MLPTDDVDTSKKRRKRSRIIKLLEEKDPYWAARNGLWAESYSPWHGKWFGILEPVNAASALFGLGIYLGMAADTLKFPFHARSAGLHVLVAINLLSSFVAHATAIDIFCWMDGGSLLWATSYELGFVVYRAYLFNNMSVALGVLAVILAMWRVPLEAGFAIGLLAIVSIHYRCLDVPPWVLWTPELDQIRSHSVSAVYWILSATAFWLFDKLTHKWQVFGHAWWHGICACGVGHLISAAALSHVAHG